MQLSTRMTAVALLLGATTAPVLAEYHQGPMMNFGYADACEATPAAAGEVTHHATSSWMRLANQVLVRRSTVGEG
jgi:hypothetical protein